MPDVSRANWNAKVLEGTAIQKQKSGVVTGSRVRPILEMLNSVQAGKPPALLAMNKFNSTLWSWLVTSDRVHRHRRHRHDFRRRRRRHRHGFHRHRNRHHHQIALHEDVPR